MKKAAVRKKSAEVEHPERLRRWAQGLMLAAMHAIPYGTFEVQDQASGQVANPTYIGKAARRESREKKSRLGTS